MAIQEVRAQRKREVADYIRRVFGSSSVSTITNMQNRGLSATVDKPDDGYNVWDVLEWVSQDRAGKAESWSDRQKKEQFLKMQGERLEHEKMLIPVELAAAGAEDFAVEVKSRFSELELTLEQVVPGCLDEVHDTLTELLRGLSSYVSTLHDIETEALKRHAVSQTA